MLRPCTMEDILQNKHRNYAHIRFEIEAFASSGTNYAEIDATRYSKPTVCASTWRRSVQRCGLQDEIKIIQNGDRVFIAHAWAL